MTLGAPEIGYAITVVALASEPRVEEGRSL